MTFQKTWKELKLKCTSNVQEPYLQIVVTHCIVTSLKLTKKANSDDQIQQSQDN